VSLEEEIAEARVAEEVCRQHLPAMMGSEGSCLSDHHICLMFPSYFFRSGGVFGANDLAAAAREMFSVCCRDLRTNSS
jgi:hypothetical protein